MQAILWRRHGDRTRAALTAARAGQGLGVVLIAFGLFGFAVGVNTGTLWTALIGWFVLTMARAEARSAGLRASFGGQRVGEAMSHDPVVGPAWLTVDGFLRGFAPHYRHLTFPVQEFDGRLTGVVSLDALRQVPPEQRTAVRVAALARPLGAIVTARPDDAAVELAAKLTASRQRLALVFDAGRLVGVVSPTDRVRASVLGQSPQADPSGTPTAPR